MSKINKVFKLVTLPRKSNDEKAAQKIIGENCFFSNPTNREINDVIASAMNCSQMSALDNFIKQENTKVYFTPSTITNDTIHMVVQREGRELNRGANITVPKDSKVSDLMRNIYVKLEDLMEIGKYQYPLKEYRPKSEYHGIIMNIHHLLHGFKTNILRKFVSKTDNKLSDAIYETYYTELYK